MTVYEFILQRCSLTDKHRQDLRTLRGFTDKTIDDLRFISGGDYILQIEPELIENYTKSELIRSGIFIENDGKISMSPILLENRIIIPYLNQDGKCYMLRPHKLGLKDVEIEFYHEFSIGDKLVITEGEFKAAACYQLGIKAIAVPGIGSFSDKHFPKLIKALHEAQVKQACIIFDNEVKDDPKFPQRFKPEPMNRWDTQFYSYFMAKMIEKEGIDCRVGTLPDIWRSDGKIDIDGALAQGRTLHDIQKVIVEAKTHRRYLEDMPEEAKTVINRKLAKKYFRSHVRREFNKYVATRYRGKHDIDEIISNFVVQIVATHDTPEGMLREVRFVNEFNEYSGSFVINAAQMTKVSDFKEFCNSKGNYIWSGKMEDLDVIWANEYLNDTGLRIHEPDHIGYLEHDKIWLFGNVAFKEEKEYRPDPSHIFWIDKKGYKPISLNLASGKNVVNEGLSYLNTNKFDMEEYKKKLEESIGETEARMALGWCAAVMFMDDVFKKYGCFPFLFITGKRSSGKSTIGDWLMNLFGFENSGKMASDSTSVAIQRYLSYYSSLPLFIDEYRNTANIVFKNGMLRNAYNRQSAGKGIKSDFGVREAKIRGTILFCGEETPEDNALLTRCVVVMITPGKRKTNHYNWFMGARTKSSNFFYELLKKRNTLRPAFLDTLEKGREYITGQGFDDRTALNFAIVAAGCMSIFKDSDMVEFAKQIMVQIEKTHNIQEDEQIVKVFLNDLIYLKTIKKINEKFWLFDEDKIYIYFHGLYSVWAEDFRKKRGIEAFKEGTVRAYMEEENGFVHGNTKKMSNGERKNYMVFDLKQAPEELLELTNVPFVEK